MCVCLETMRTCIETMRARMETMRACIQEMLPRVETMGARIETTLVRAMHGGQAAELICGRITRMQRFDAIRYGTKQFSTASTSCSIANGFRIRAQMTSESSASRATCVPAEIRTTAGGEGFFLMLMRMSV
jgi:hypothetical protein